MLMHILGYVHRAAQHWAEKDSRFRGLGQYPPHCEVQASLSHVPETLFPKEKKKTHKSKNQYAINQ